MDWPSLTDEDQAFAAIVARLIALRRGHPLLRQERYLHGEHVTAHGPADVTWLTPDGRVMTPADWQDSQRRCLGLVLADAQRMIAVLLNAGSDAQPFNLPSGSAWRVLLDTSDHDRLGPAGENLVLGAKSLVLAEMVDDQSDSTPRIRGAIAGSHRFASDPAFQCAHDRAHTRSTEPSSRRRPP